MNYKERFTVWHESITGILFHDTQILESLELSDIFKQIQPFWDVAVRIGDKDRYVMQQLHAIAIHKYMKYQARGSSQQPWDFIKQDADVFRRAWSVAYSTPLCRETISLWGSQGHDALDTIRVNLIRKYL